MLKKFPDLTLISLLLFTCTYHIRKPLAIKLLFLITTCFAMCLQLLPTRGGGTNSTGSLILGLDVTFLFWQGECTGILVLFPRYLALGLKTSCMFLLPPLEDCLSCHLSKLYRAETSHPS